MSVTTDASRGKLIIPGLGRLYSALHDAGETVLRVVAGGFLAIHGSQKIVNPLGAVEMVEGLVSIPACSGRPCLPAPNSSAAS